MKKEQKHKIIRYTFISCVFILFALMFWPFFKPILLAALFAFALHDIVNKFAARFLNRTYASLIIIFSLILFIAAPIVFIVLKAIATIKSLATQDLQNSPMYQSTLSLLHQVTDGLTSIADRFDLDLSKLPKPVEILNEYSGEIGAFATSSAAKLPQIGLALFVFFLALYYFLTQSDKIKKHVLKLDALSPKEINNIIDIVKSSSYLTLIASLFIGGVQALIISIFAYFCGFENFFIVFILTFISSLIPVVGSAPVPLFLMAISFIQGNTGAGIAMLISSGIAGGVDNLIKPLILNSANEDFHPILSLLALIGAIIIYGPTGILLGPILTQLAFNILPILTSEEKSGEIPAPETTQA